MNPIFGHWMQCPSNAQRSKNQPPHFIELCLRLTAIDEAAFRELFVRLGVIVLSVRFLAVFAKSRFQINELQIRRVA
ncbi:valine--tRNA ligase [Paraburkholderia fungorum]|uniref:valine--tRNA ligase n=1 Tax=Paraburkholderia fungorum TaxID=134537 RepID=UPI0009458517|nr:valine--tRNA ligase [Paraburkholderia fungorum]